MHLGLNLVYWQPDSGGSGTYARELIRALRAARPGLRITGWVGTGAPADIGALDVEWVRLPLKSAGSPVHVGYELAGMGLDARRRGVDLVHGLAYASPALAPGVATVVTLHDLTWWHQPDAATPLARRMFRLLTELCGRTADRVIAVSETAKADLVATAGIPAQKIDVAAHGVNPDPLAAPTPAAELRERLGLPDGAPVVLCVGQLARHKNIAALVRALPELPGARLVVPGRATEHRDELEALARERGVRDRLVLPGFVDDPDLEGLYALADCFALPSFLEGFGMPLLEAMRRGVPVACSNVSALPEVAGDAALLFDPRDDASVAGALQRVLGDGALRERLVAAGLARAAEFTWARAAEATLASYERALGRA
jgi:glycosyltransferase involved in cell wall biosynthesis